MSTTIRWIDNQLYVYSKSSVSHTSVWSHIWLLWFISCWDRHSDWQGLGWWEEGRFLVSQYLTLLDFANSNRVEHVTDGSVCCLVIHMYFVSHDHPSPLCYSTTAFLISRSSRSPLTTFCEDFPHSLPNNTLPSHPKRDIFSYNFHLINADLVASTLVRHWMQKADFICNNYKSNQVLLHNLYELMRILMKSGAVLFSARDLIMGRMREEDGLGKEIAVECYASLWNAVHWKWLLLWSIDRIQSCIQNCEFDN